MTRWLSRPDGAVAWLVLLVAVFNFAPAQFSREYLAEQSAATRLIKDVPVMLLIVSLVAWIVRRRRMTHMRALVKAFRPRIILRALRRDIHIDDAVPALAMIIVLLALFMAMRTVLTDSATIGTAVSARYYVLYPALALLVALAGPLRVTRLGAGLVVLAVVQTVLATMDYAGLVGPTFYAGNLDVAGHVFPRAIGTLGNPNNLGLFLGFAFIVVLASAKYQTSAGKVIAAALMVGLLMTASKTALIAVAIAAIALMWKAHERPRLTMKVAGVVVACAALTLPLALYRLDRAPSASGVLGTRSPQAQEALETWLATPDSVVAGHGFDAHVSLESDSGIRETVVDAMPLALALEGGLIAIVLMAMMVAVGARLIVLCPPDRRLRDVAIGFGVVMLVFTPLASNLRLFPASLFFWILVGCCGSAALERARAGASGLAEPQAASESARRAEAAAG